MARAGHEFAGRRARHQQETRSAITLLDRNLTWTALIARPIGLRQSANENLAAVIPTVPEIAVAFHQRERIQADLDRGCRPEQILASADLPTVVALMDWLPTMPRVKDSQHREAIMADLGTLALDRLATLGYQPAVDRLKAEQEIASPAAWARVFSEALAGQVSVAAWTDLHRADPPGRSGGSGGRDRGARRRGSPVRHLAGSGGRGERGLPGNPVVVRLIESPGVYGCRGFRLSALLLGGSPTLHREPGPAQAHGHALRDLPISTRGDVPLQECEFMGILPETAEDH